MSSDLAVRVQGVSKAYQIYERPRDRLKQMLWCGKRKFHDEFWALRDIDFEVKRGETVGIIGRNGSGKSTLLQIVCGTVTPTEGRVERNGRISALLELGSGFNPEFTGRENVFLNGAILGISRPEMEARFDGIAAFADIGDFIDSPVKHYSSGMFARLAFSVAIHVDPDILIVDEILAVGDAAFQRRCMNKFYEIRDSGCSILFVSHDQYQVKSICQRALYLEKGKQKMFGYANRVIDQYTIDIEEGLTAARDAIPSEHGAAAKPEGRVEEEAPAAPDQLFRITEVQLLDANGAAVTRVTTGQPLSLQFEYQALTETPPEEVSFVFNLYRHDGLYVCGTTTTMDGLSSFRSARRGRIAVQFSSFPLLSGKYRWRVAVNDVGGFITYAEAKDVAEFLVEDNFDAVGVVSLERTWDYVPLP